MFTCIHDPGLALFLAETPFGKARPGLLEWAALGGTVLMAAMALGLAV